MRALRLVAGTNACTCPSGNSLMAMFKRFSDSLFAPLGVGFLCGAVTVGTLVLVWPHDSPSRSRSPAAPYTTSVAWATVPQAADSAMARVASRFVCSCGTCGEKRLDVCTCETAQQERAFIQDQLRQGRSEAEAADALNQKYGGLKPGPA